MQKIFSSPGDISLSQIAAEPGGSAKDNQPAPASPAFVQLGTVLAGAAPFKIGNNVNDTYRGQILGPDGKVRAAIIKDLDQRQLANELMAAALGHASGLPIPQAYVAAVQNSVLPAKKGPVLADGSRLVFASADASTPPVSQLYTGTPPDTVRKRLADWDGIGNVYGFDSWVANIDRHEGNLLFSGDKQVWLIDHGHCFTGSQWKQADLDPNKEYQNRLKSWLTPSMTDQRRAAVAANAAKLQQQVEKIDPTELGKANNVSALLDAGDFMALTEFLKSRCANVPRLAAAALNISLTV